jgi:hypothetical protein
MNGKDGKELMNVIISDPKIFYSIVLNAAKAKKQQHEISEFVEMHLMRILSKTKQLDKKVGGIKNTIGKIALSAGLLVAASIGMVIGGASLPALIVPATIAAVKFGPVIGEKLGNSVVENSTTIRNEAVTLNQAKTAGISNSKIITKKRSKSLEKILSKEKVKSIAKGVDIKSNTPSMESLKSSKVLAQKGKSAHIGR